MSGERSSKAGVQVAGVFATIVGAVVGGIAYRVAYDGTYNLFSKKREEPAPVVAPPLPPPPRLAQPPIEPPPRVEPKFQPPKIPAPFLPPPVAPKKEEPPEANPVRPFDVDPQAKSAGPTLYLTFLKPFAYQTGPWKLGMGVKGDDGVSPIVVQKKEHKYGISLHPPQTGVCRVSFVPGKEFKRFKGWVGIGDYFMNPGGTVGFAVSGDGKKLWESAGKPTAGAAVPFAVDVTGVEVLTLETFMRDGSNHAANAVWVDPWFER